MAITIEKVPTEAAAFGFIRRIRYKVFVEGQDVPEAEEFDTYETTATHFLARWNEQPAGAARWRRTEDGFKLERFAVLSEFRLKGLGSALVQRVLDDLPTDTAALIYLHAQFPAVPLYEKFGFRKVGSPFQECNIWHFRMEKPAAV